MTILGGACKLNWPGPAGCDNHDYMVPSLTCREIFERHQHKSLFLVRSFETSPDIFAANLPAPVKLASATVAIQPGGNPNQPSWRPFLPRKVRTKVSTILLAPGIRDCLLRKSALYPICVKVMLYH